MNEIHLETIDSTNVYAKSHAAHFPKDEITCISADEQTGGKGRFGRVWISPKGVNLYVTFYFRLPSKTRDLISLAQVMASSMAHVLIEEGLNPRIKWPNDLQLDGKKCAGILCETVFSGDDVEIFLGVGLNVNMKEEDFRQVGQPATSLLAITGKKWDRDRLLKAIQDRFVADLIQFKQKGFAPFHKFVEARLAFKGQTVHCFDGKKEWTGICHSLAQDGQLNLLLEDHTLHKVISGEISF